MRIYIGTRLGGFAQVIVREGEQLRPLRHHAGKSPTGFDWGIAGIGAAALARAILVDHFAGMAPCPRCQGEGADIWADDGHCWVCDGSGVDLPVSFLEFKLRFIDPLPVEERWEISAAEIDVWLRTVMAGRARAAERRPR